MSNLKLTDRILRRGKALGAIKTSGPIERAAARLLLYVYKRRLRGVAAVAPAWGTEEIPSVSIMESGLPHRRKDNTLNNLVHILIGLVVLSLVAGCGAGSVSATPTPTETPVPPTPQPSATAIPSPTPTATPTATPVPTNTPLPTATPTPQTLGRVFPEEFHGQAVWSNADGNADRDFRDRGWFCPPDGRSTSCVDHVIHFDVSVPTGFGPEDPVLSPVDGDVFEIYDPGEGNSIRIFPEPGFAGVEELLANRERIEVLSKGIFEFDYELDDVESVSLHVAHVIPLVEEGDIVRKGEPIAKVYFDTPHDPKKIGYVIYIHMRDGTYYQFGPCDVPNEGEFCGKCAPGSYNVCP